MIRQAALVRKAAWYVPVTRPLVLLLLGTLTWVHCLSQALPEQRRTARPKLGLVLEGGGASGLAHIGVITWMEEHRIPVSYVAGTSMGGLVGRIYGTGRSPAEVRELINGIG
jgi:NTE family protein